MTNSNKNITACAGNGIQKRLKNVCPKGIEGSDPSTRTILDKTLSINNKALLLAVDKGYVIDDLGIVKNKKNKEVKGCIHKGYKVFSVRFNKSKIIKAVPFHKLQAYQKYKEKLFEPGIEIRHLNSNPLDNSINNIQIGSHQENIMDKTPQVRHINAMAGALKVRKLTKEQLIEFRKDRDNGFTYRELISKYKISKSTVSYICNNKTYKYEF